MMPRLKAGDQAPDFALTDQHGKTVKLADLRGRKLLLYFYPKANTPGCTKQACSVRDAREDLSALGVAAVGISPDAPDKQAEFDEKYGLAFPLLSDRDHAVARAYGVWSGKSVGGIELGYVVRSSFLIAEDGTIARAWYKISPADTVPKAREALAPLAATDA